MKEQWLPIPGWEGLYEVSDHGRVRSLDRWVTRSNGQRVHYPGRMKSLPRLQTGYPVVHLSKDGRLTTKAVHTVVLETFVGPRLPGTVCCHKDGDPTNNRLTNLRWDTQSNNLKDAVRHGTHSSFRRARSTRSQDDGPIKGERWRPVIDFDRFEVSDQGRVRIAASRRVVATRLSATGGYVMVTLNMNGQKTSRRVHRLVLEAFVGPCPGGEYGCHIDGDPTNNRLKNLRWDTQAHNLRDVVRHGRHAQANKTHCLRGHEYTAKNTTLTAKGHRQCRQCSQAVHAKRRALHRDRIREQKRASWQRKVEAEGRVYTPNGPARRGTATHCASGHERTPENTYYELGSGQRRCAVCRQEQRSTRYRERREQEGKPYFPGGVRTHCYKGHEFTEENTLYQGGARRCRTCREAYVAERSNPRSHCKKGHPLTAENTDGGRSRQCLTCRDEADRERELRLARRNYCKRGHEFTEENTSWGKDGRRRCCICRRDRARANKLADKEAFNERARRNYKARREAAGHTYRAGNVYTHCKHGHELTPENIYLKKQGGRRGCKTCRSIRGHIHYISNLDAAKEYRREYYLRRKAALKKNAEAGSLAPDPPAPKGRRPRTPGGGGAGPGSGLTGSEAIKTGP